MDREADRERERESERESERERERERENVCDGERGRGRQKGERATEREREREREIESERCRMQTQNVTALFFSIGQLASAGKNRPSSVLASFVLSRRWLEIFCVHAAR